MNLAVERPLLPLLANAVPHHEAGDVVVRALMQMIGPAVEQSHAGKLHVEDLEPLLESRHLADEDRRTAPCALRVLGEVLPHLVKPALLVELHESLLAH